MQIYDYLIKSFLRFDTILLAILEGISKEISMRLLIKGNLKKFSRAKRMVKLIFGIFHNLSDLDADYF